MATSDLSFADISPAAIEQAEEYLVALLKEEYPSADLSQGRVIREHVLNIAAILHAINREDIERLRNSFSPVVIATDPTAADDDIVDAVYANYGVERFDGSKATGYVVIIIEALITTSVPDTTVFTANGLDYVVTQSYIGVTSSDAVVTAAERLITARDDGTYSFTVPVVAAAVGEAYRAERGTRFTAASAIPDTIDIQAAADFSGGLDEETNAELTARVQQGIAPKVFGGRAQNAALLRDTLDSLVDVSQVGFGDPEMLRDRDNIFQMSTGGKTDLWVQPSAVPNEVKLTKECTYVGDDIWQFSLLRDDAPGFYLVTAIVPYGTTAFTGGFTVTSEVRGLDLTAETDWVHTVDNMVQGAYSRYQTAVVQFEDPDTLGTTVVGAKANYDVYVLCAPSIATLHALTIDRDARQTGGDYLVRAAVPALASVSLQINKRANTASPDVTAVAQAIYSRVNSLGFQLGRLPMSLIIAAAQSAMESGGTHTITPIDLRAYVYPPDTVPAGRILLQDVNVLEVPNLPARGITQRTTVFYMPLTAISVTVQSMPGVSI